MLHSHAIEKVAMMQRQRRGEGSKDDSCSETKASNASLASTEMRCAVWHTHKPLKKKKGRRKEKGRREWMAD